jgi:hypothetical protein
MTLKCILFSPTTCLKAVDKKTDTDSVKPKAEPEKVIEHLNSSLYVTPLYGM